MTTAKPEYHEIQMSVWQQGATAARQGLPSFSNPFHPLKYEFVSWHNGWAAATHHKAKEDDEL